MAPGAMNHNANRPGSQPRQRGPKRLWSAIETLEMGTEHVYCGAAALFLTAYAVDFGRV